MTLHKVQVLAESGSAFWRLRSLLVLVLLLVVGALVALDGRAVARPATSQYAGPDGCVWSIVTTTNPNTYNSFHSVSAISSNDIWAVGSQGPGNFGQLTLIEHWNGALWSIVPSPSPGTGENELLAATAVSSNDVWAAGFATATGSNNRESLILHWDGVAWIRTPSPNPGTFHNDIFGLDAVSSNDVWAVGYMWLSGNRHQTMVLHWNGTEWGVVSSPNASTYDNELTSVSVISANNIWAAGQYMAASGLWQTLILHWDGSSWTVVASPNIVSTNNLLNGISILSGSEGWAAGYTCTGNCIGGSNSRLLLTLHWDGSAWGVVPTSDFGASDIYLNDVVTLSPSDAWAVGAYYFGLPLTFVAHWDGSTWSQVPSDSPDPHTCCPELEAVTALPNGDLWSVGDYHFPASQVFRTLAERYPTFCDSTATPTPLLTNSPTSTLTPPPANTNIPTDTTTSTPSPAPTNTRISTNTATPALSSTPVSATNTPHDPTATSQSTITPAPSDTPIPPAPTQTATQLPTQTSTTCSIQFSDVPEGSTFHSFVKCLACKGVLAGYADGTFRPGDSVTRGQLSKIVSNAAGWFDMPSGQSFEDVPPTHTFYLFVERLSSRDIILGYACNEPSEPCGPGNLPYFRPGNNATRGQIAKIVSNAASFSGDPGAQIFEDVPSTGTFYTWVQRLASPGIMSGYPCGGTGEPCGPGNRPYFRPSGLTTRGQTAKIIANTFFPNCENQQR